MDGLFRRTRLPLAGGSSGPHGVGDAFDGQLCATRALLRSVNAPGPLGYVLSDDAVAAWTPTGVHTGVGLLLLHAVERALRAAFFACNAWILLAFSGWVFGTVLHPDRLSMVEALQYLFVPVATLQMLLYAMALVVCASTRVQGYITFGHVAKRLGPVHRAGPGDRDATLLGIRSYAVPARAGLHRTRNVSFTTNVACCGDGRGGHLLGAWHVLPAGRVACSVGSAGTEDERFDAALRKSGRAHVGAEGGPSSAGVVGMLYLHGQGESRSRCVLL